MCTDIPNLSFTVICKINCAVYLNASHMRVVQVRHIYGWASDYGQSQIIIAWLCMTPAVDHVLCNRTAVLEQMKITCYVQVLVLQVHIMSNWTSDLSFIFLIPSPLHSDTVKYKKEHATIAFLSDMFMLHNTIIHPHVGCSVQDMSCSLYWKV
jgi:hypothetical protein